MVTPTKSLYSNLLNIDAVRQCTEHLTVSRIASILHYIFNAGNKVVYIHDQPTSVEDIARTGSLQDRLGNKVVIWFTGGPPDERGWYEGTMLSMLLDYILRSALAEDHKRIEELCHILN